MTLEWFCTQGGEGGRYTLGLEAAAIFDPHGGAPGYEFPDGSKAAGTPPLTPYPNPSPNPSPNPIPNPSPNPNPNANPDPDPDPNPN